MPNNEVFLSYHDLSGTFRSNGRADPTTRLVCETHLPFSDRIQVSSPADVAGILQEYFRDKDREEFLIVLLSTANVIIGLSQISVGGLAASIVEPLVGEGVAKKEMARRTWPRSGASVNAGRSRESKSCYRRELS